ncbi:hypothetical protein CRUP_030973 [Coryphaenoides rupestris]|nr:hypothetical protein CRUP_030973 [Coryphaenoides rupestris]
MPPGKNFRRRRNSSDVEDEEDEVTQEVRSKMEEAKELQSLRKRQTGISLAALLEGEMLPPGAEVDDDPFKMKTGGVVDMKKVKDRNRDMGEEETDLSLGSSFSAETNRRDEDADMMKYIETELKKKKGLVEAEEQKVKVKNAEDLLYELPENIRVNSAKKTEEMLSNQMLSGIPESIVRIPTQLTGTTGTINKRSPKQDPCVWGTQRNLGQRVTAPSPPNYRKRPNNEKATDDYHYEKFKKMNRRY